MNAAVLTKLVVVLFTLGLSACAVTPQPLPEEDVLADVSASLKTLDDEQAEEPISAPITIHEAIVRTVKYNRERRVQLMTQALEQDQIQLAQFDMLPQLTLDAGYESRSNEDASSSRSIRTGTESLEPSVSSDRSSYSAGAEFSWNVLDFGLSYVRAKQQSERFLIARERERKVVHNITQRARDAFWRAVSAERLLARIDPLAVKVQSALESSRKIEDRRLGDPLDALDYQRELLEALRTLQNLKRSLVGAKAELATLMGLRPGTDFALAMPDAAQYEVPALAFSLDEIERTAFLRRPELMEARYSARIAEGEARVALLRLLPGINLNLGGRYDDDSFLVNSSWATLGASVAWNLLNVFRYPTEKQVAEDRIAVVEEQRLALYMAVLGQVHLARVRFLEAINDFEVSREYLDVIERISGRTRDALAASRAGEMDVIRTDLDAVVAELRRDVAYSELQNSFVQVFVTMGLDPLPDEVSAHDVATLARAAEDEFNRWLEGDRVLVAEDAPPADPLVEPRRDYGST